MIEELKKIVAKEKDEIRHQYKAEVRGIFGSYARGDFHDDSCRFTGKIGNLLL